MHVWTRPNIFHLFVTYPHNNYYIHLVPSLFNSPCSNRSYSWCRWNRFPFEPIPTIILHRAIATRWTHLTSPLLSSKYTISMHITWPTLVRRMESLCTEYPHDRSVHAFLSWSQDKTRAQRRDKVEEQLSLSALVHGDDVIPSVMHRHSSPEKCLKRLAMPAH